MNKEKKLVKNVIIFAIGSLASKILQFLLIPFYTRVLTNYEYGIIDILQSLGTLLIPIISLAISEAVFRYTMDKNANKESVLSSGLFVAIINVFLVLIIAFICYAVFKIDYVFTLWLYISTYIVRTIFSQYVRAIEKVKMYTIDNLLNVIITIAFSILFISILGLSVNGYLLGYVCGNVFSILFLNIFVRVYKSVSVKNVEKGILKKMIKFSFPLIPSSICWWLMTFTDRIMIVSKYGASINGIYAISNKVPQIVTILTGIFFQAWQISANNEINSKEISNFYSRIFKMLFTFSFVMCSCLIVSCKLITKVIAGSEFLGAWYYMPVLLLGTAFFSLGEFLGTIYVASKKTKMAFITNMIAAITNILFNYILLTYIGPIGAAIATMICYFVLWIYRVFDTRKIIRINYDYKRIISTLILVISIVVIVTIELKYWYIYVTILEIIVILLNGKELINLFNFCKTMIKEKLKIKNKESKVKSND